MNDEMTPFPLSVIVLPLILYLDSGILFFCNYPILAGIMLVFGTLSILYSLTMDIIVNGP